jgi:8-oxo-dGTP diphosphatase
MIKVHFYSEDEIPQELFKFAVIVSSYKDKWIFCRHKLRDTWEIPGGHRELGEDIAETARRELYEETGALDFIIKPVSVYEVENNGQTTYGALFNKTIYKT